MAGELKSALKAKEEIMTGDSGASSHMGDSEEGLVDWEFCRIPVTVGNGHTLCARKVGLEKTENIRCIHSFIKLSCEEVIV